MELNITENSDKELKEQIKTWSEKIFTHTDRSSDLNIVLFYTPLIQVAQNELTTRFVKRTTFFTLLFSVLALLVSLTALLVAK